MEIFELDFFKFQCISVNYARACQILGPTLPHLFLLYRACAWFICTSGNISQNALYKTKCSILWYINTTGTANRMNARPTFLRAKTQTPHCGDITWQTVKINTMHHILAYLRRSIIAYQLMSLEFSAHMWWSLEHKKIIKSFV